MLVAHAQCALQVCRDAVPIDREDRTGDGVRHDAVPAGCIGGQATRRVGVDRSRSGELGTIIMYPGQGENRDSHLHVR